MIMADVSFKNDDGSEVSVCLHGATVISWKHKGEEKLFCSAKSVFDNKKAIRGGIPIVFPNFGPWELGPQHGFARIKQWKLAQVPAKNADGSISAGFSLDDDDETRSMWNAKFQLIYTVTLGTDDLQTELCVTNRGSQSFLFTTLMHTYFRVANIEHTRILGLQGLSYVDKVHGGEHIENRSEVYIDENYDRVYQLTKSVQIITDVNSRKNGISLSTSNLPDIVVWNPWSDKAKAMSDFGDEEYKEMLCVEAGAVSTPVSLPAGESVKFSQKIVAKL